jgi:hypothetical protein
MRSLTPAKGIAMRASLLAMIVLAAPALGGAPDALAIAPAGVCAGEEPGQALPAPPGPPGTEAVRDESRPPLAGALHLSPNDVAVPVAQATETPPGPPGFAGPGPCDNPGSGCAGEKIVDDRDPGSGCGFPGSPCP